MNSATPLEDDTPFTREAALADTSQEKYAALARYLAGRKT